MVHPITRMFYPEIETIIDAFDGRRCERIEGRGRGHSLVVILRGMPGSGKSTFASLMKIYVEGKGLETMICSADDFFWTPQGHRFDGNQLPAAHDWCKARFRHSLSRVVPVVIVDNTNVKISEWLEYCSFPQRLRAHELACVTLACHVYKDAEAFRFRAPPGRVFPQNKLQRRYEDFERFTPEFARLSQRAEAFVVVEPICAIRDIRWPDEGVPPASIEAMFFEEIRDIIDLFVAHRAKYAKQREAAYAVHDYSHASHADWRTRDGLVVILRGVSGCGKSTFAEFMKLYASAFRLTTQICSKDDFFRKDDGEFVYSPKQLLDGENECSAYFESARQRRCDVVVVNNPNITELEWESYSRCVADTTDWLYHVNFSCGILHEGETETFEPELFTDAEALAHRSYHRTSKDTTAVDIVRDEFGQREHPEILLSLARRSFHRMSEEERVVEVVRHKYGTRAFVEAPRLVSFPHWADDVERVSITVTPRVNTWDTHPTAEDNRAFQQ